MRIVKDAKPGRAPLGSFAWAVRLAWTGAASGLAAALPAVAAGQTAASAALRDFDIPAGPLDAALDRFARDTGVTVDADPALVGGKRSPGLRGAYAVPDALARLLAGSGLEARPQAGGRYVVGRETAAAAPGASPEAELPEIRVQGAPARLHETPPEPAGLKASAQESATKMAMPIRETPQAISVITRDSMDRRQVRDVNGALELAAGFTASGSAFAGHNPRTGEEFVLRGQTLNPARDLRIDGFSAVSDRNNIDLAPFERVEAIKGPSSMLYGQGSLGGFINLVRKKPQAERSAKATLQAGSFDTYRAEADFAGALDANERVLGQLTTAYERSGSFIDGVKSQRSVVAPGLEVRLGERTRAQLMLLYQDDRFVPSLGTALHQRGGELVPPDVPRSFFFGVPPTHPSTADAAHGSLRIDHEVADRWLATLVLQGTRNRLMGIADSYGYGIDELGNTGLYSSWVAHDNRSWAGELRIDGRFDAFGREHRVLFGVEGNQQKFFAWGGGGYPSIGTGNIYEGFADAPTVPGASNPQNYRFDDRLWTTAAYAQVQLSLTDRAKLLLGTRYDEARQRAQDVFGEGPRVYQTDRAQTYRAALTYDLTPSVTAYASYAQSFNPVTERSRAGGILDPERGKGYEIGMKAEAFDRKLLATLALFRMELRDSPIPDPSNAPSENFSVSAGKQRSKGVEVEVQGEPRPGLTVGAAAAWLDAEFVDPLDPNHGLTPGGTVKRQASLYAEHEWRAGPLEGLGLGAQWVHVGDRIVLTDRNLTVKGYDRFDLYASYRWKDWNVSLQVRNVTDERYIEQVNSAFLYAHFFGAPRSYLLRAEYRFK